MPRDKKNRPRTGFSFCRLTIPERCGYRGRALYLDADMLVFADLAELWQIPFGEQSVLCTWQSEPPPDWRDNPAFHTGRHYAVMLLDCDRLPWHIEEIIRGLDEDIPHYIGEQQLEISVDGEQVKVFILPETPGVTLNIERQVAPGPAQTAGGGDAPSNPNARRQRPGQAPRDVDKDWMVQVPLTAGEHQHVEDADAGVPDTSNEFPSQARTRSQSGALVDDSQPSESAEMAKAPAAPPVSVPGTVRNTGPAGDTAAAEPMDSGASELKDSPLPPPIPAPPTQISRSDSDSMEAVPPVAQSQSSGAGPAPAAPAAPSAPNGGPIRF